MNYEEMTKEELAKELRALNDYMENIVVFWGDKKGFRAMFKEVACNDKSDYTPQEAVNAKYILETEGAFERFIELLQDSFEKGGIYHAISEKMSYIMEQVAQPQKVN
jgi:hypothetical protein